MPRLHLDLERARREGWQFGAKLVRGAYMEHERKRAAKLGYEDPIQPTAEATHANYTEALELLLSPPRRASTARVPPCTRPSSTPAPPQGAPGASGPCSSALPGRGPACMFISAACFVSRPDATWLMVATHNEASITHAAGALLNGEATVPPRQVLGTVTADPLLYPGCNPMHPTQPCNPLHPSSPLQPQVAFGQLLGMADHLTFALGARGLKAYKYVPWGR